MKNLDLVAILDCETTGLDIDKSEVIELACILYSLSHHSVLQQVSTLVPVSTINNPVEHLNGICADTSRLITASLAEPMVDHFEKIINFSGAVIAHNAAFDKAFVETVFGYPVGGENKPWIDTLEIDWPLANHQGSNLVELALSYGVPVWSNHRALTDCQLLAHILQREPNVFQLLTKELEPKVWAMWRSSYDDKGGQAMAKASGFRWNRQDCPMDRVWSRKIHPDDVASLSFVPMIRALGQELNLT